MIKKMYEAYIVVTIEAEDEAQAWALANAAANEANGSVSYVEVMERVD